jgi:hypothetical protein
VNGLLRLTPVEGWQARTCAQQSKKIWLSRLVRTEQPEVLVMKGLWLSLSLAVTTALPVVLCCCSGNSGVSGLSDEAQVRRILELELELMRGHDWRELYELYSPALHEECSYDEFLGAWQYSSDVDLYTLDYDDLEVQVEGTRAYATYILTYGGEDVHAASEQDPDIFIRIDGRWYDEVDSHTKCY